MAQANSKQEARGTRYGRFFDAGNSNLKSLSLQRSEEMCSLGLVGAGNARDKEECEGEE